MMFASTLAVILRLIARLVSTAKYGYDDIFIVIALVRQSPGTARNFMNIEYFSDTVSSLDFSIWSQCDRACWYVTWLTVSLTSQWVLI